jgi:hypothetical protein
MSAASALAGCLPTPAAEAGPNPALARLCVRALALHAAEQRLHARRHTIAEEEATDAELGELQDERFAALWGAALTVPESLADARQMARLAYAVGAKAADGYLDYTGVCDVEAAIACRVVEYLADAPVGIEPGEAA